MMMLENKKKSAINIEIDLPGGVTFLNKDNFSSETYVTEARRVIPLPQLRVALAREGEKVKERLFQFVNDRHRDVVTLSNDLGAATRHLPLLKEHVQGYLAIAECLLVESQTVLKEIQDTLKEHNTLQTEKSEEEAILMVYRIIRTGLQHVESLQYSTLPSSSSRICLILELLSCDLAAVEAILLEQHPSIATVTNLQTTATTSHNTMIPVPPPPPPPPPSLSDSKMLNGEKQLQQQRGDNDTQQSDTFSDDLVTKVKSTLQDLTKTLRASVISATKDSLNFILQILCESKTDNEIQIFQNISRLVSGLVNIKEEEQALSQLKETFTLPVLRKAISIATKNLKQTLTECPANDFSSSVLPNTTTNDAESLTLFLDEIKNQINTGRLQLFINLLHMWSCSPKPLKTEASSQHTNESEVRYSLCLKHLNAAEHCLLNPFLTTICETFPRCFVPLNKDLFLLNYHNTQYIIEKILVDCMSPSQQRHFRLSIEWKQFFTKWHTQVYEVSRHRQLLPSIKDNDILTLVPNDTASEFYFRTTLQFMQTVKKTLDKNSLIAREFPKALGFVAEILSVQFPKFVQKVLTACRDDDHQHISCERGGLIKKHNLLNFLICDILKVIDVLQSESIDNLATLALYASPLPSHDGLTFNSTMISKETIALHEKYIYELFSTICDVLVELQKNVETAILDIINEMLNKELIAIRGIPPVYRMTNKQVSGAPSLYVRTTNGIIDSFFKTMADANLPKRVSDEWTIQIIDMLFHTFTSRLNEVLSAVQQQEKSLRRLQRNKITTSDGKQSLTDSMKMMLQLHIDAKEFQSRWESLLLETVKSDDTFNINKNIPGFLLFQKTAEDLAISINQHEPNATE